MARAELFDGTILEFEDGTPDDVIAKVARRETDRIRTDQARQPLPEGVTPSKAGAGRGLIVPPRAPAPAPEPAAAAPMAAAPAAAAVGAPPVQDVRAGAEQLVDEYGDIFPNPGPVAPPPAASVLDRPRPPDMEETEADLIELSRSPAARQADTGRVRQRTEQGVAAARDKEAKAAAKPGLLEGTPLELVGDKVIIAGARGLAQAVELGANALRVIPGLVDETQADRLESLATWARFTGEAAQNAKSTESRAQAAELSQIIRDPQANAATVLGFLMTHPGLVAEMTVESGGAMMPAVGAGRLTGELTARLAARALGQQAPGRLAAAEIARMSQIGAAGGAGAANVAMGAGSVFEDVLRNGGTREEAYRAAGATAIGYALAARATGGGAEASLAGAGRTSALRGAGREGAQEAMESLSESGGTAFADFGERGGNIGEAVRQAAAEGTIGAVAGGAVELRPSRASERYSRARDAGFHVDPPLTTDTPEAQRKKTNAIFTSMAAQYGVPRDAVQRAMKAAEGMPLAKVGAFYKSFANALGKRGQTGAPIDEHAADTLDAGPMAPPPEETKPAAPAPTPAPAPAPATAKTEAVSNIAKLLGVPVAPAPTAPAPAGQKDSAETPAPNVAAAPAPAPAAPATLDEAAHEAATSPTNDRPEPTPAQIEAGTYKKGHYRISGLPVSIENDEGSIRRSKPDAPVRWERKIARAHYGYIRRTVGSDGEQVDTFIKPSTPRDFDGTAFVIDQVDPATGRHDEHKVMLGYGSEAEARAAYLANYPKGWKGIGAITAAPMADLKTWLAGDTSGPFNKEAGHGREPDVAATPVAASDAAVGGRDQPGGSLATVGPDAALAPVGRRGAAAAQPAAGGRAAGAVGDAGGDAAAVTGPRVIAKAGMTPAQATPLELRENADGSLTPWHDGYELNDYDSGEPLSLPAGTSDAEALKIIKASRAFGRRTKVFSAGPKGADDAAGEVDEQTGVRAEREDGDRGGQAAEAGGGDRVLAAAGSGAEAEGAAAAPEVAPQEAAPPAAPTVADIHALADRLGVPWDNDPAFMKLTKEVSGKEHLDELNGPERQALADRLNGGPRQGGTPLSPAEQRANTLAGTAMEFGSVIIEESRTEDFDPKELAVGIRQWTEGREFTAQELAAATIESLNKDKGKPFRRKLGVIAELRKIAAPATPAASAEDDPGAQWTRMPDAERRAVAARAGLSATTPVVRMAWADINKGRQAKLTAAMEPAAAPPAAAPAPAPDAPEIDRPDTDKATLDALESGDRIVLHRGTEFEERIWIDETKAGKVPTWVVKSRSADTNVTITKGPVGPDRQWGWGRHDAARKALEAMGPRGEASTTPPAEPPAAADLRIGRDGVLLEVGDNVRSLTRGTHHTIGKFGRNAENNPIAIDTDGRVIDRTHRLQKVEIGKSAATPRPQPGEPGYTLDMAQADLDAMQANTGERGGVLDDRLTDRIKRQERLIADMRAEAAPAPKTTHIATPAEKPPDTGNAPRIRSNDADGRWSYGIEYHGAPPAAAKARRDVVDYMNGDIDKPTLIQRLADSGLGEGQVWNVTNRIGDHFVQADMNDVDAIREGKKPQRKNQTGYDAPAAHSTDTKEARQAFARDDTAGYLRARIPEVLRVFGGKLSIARVLNNLGDPSRPGHLLDEDAARAAIDALVQEGTLQRVGTSSVLLAEPGPTPDAAPRAPVTPQVPAEPGTKYVLPSFVTAPHAKPAKPAKAAKPARAAPIKAEAGDSEAIRQAKADALKALGDLSDILGKPGRLNIVPEQEQKLLPVLTRLFDAAFRLGYLKFKEAARWSLDQIRNALGDEAANSITIDHLQGAYIGMAGRYRDAGAERPAAVAAVESLDEIGIGDDNALPEANDGQDNARADGPAALEPVAAEEGGAPESRGDAERGDPGGGTGGPAGDSRPDEPGVSGTRSGGSGSTSVRAPKTGAGGGGRRRGKGRAGGAGSPVPAGNARDAVAPDAAPDLAPEPPATEPVSVPNLPAVNFRITPELRLGQGGEVEKFKDNLAAIRTLKAIEAEGRRATPAEQRVLARYVGWGGLANAFENRDTKAYKDATWEARGKELAELLTPKELQLARRSTLDAHYTSQDVVSAMWDAVRRLGFQGGTVLESSMGAGNFLGLMPEALLGQTRFIGVEYDSLTARIAALLYPQETVLNSGFQKVPLSDGSFDLSIGNPPFGEQSLRFQFKPELNGASIHNQFFRAALDALKPGGLQVQVVSRYLLDKLDRSDRVALAKKARLLGAIRLPDTAFKENARTEVVTDILFLQRLTPDEEAHMGEVFDAAAKPRVRDYKAEQVRRELAEQVPAWVETTQMPDPLGGDTMVVNRYFADNPRMVLGTLERSGSMQFGGDITVRFDKGANFPEALAAAVARLPQGVMTQAPDAIAESLARFNSMSDALRIALAGHEAGAIKFDAGGKLHQVVERENPQGDWELAQRELTAASPWSETLMQSSDGTWYTLVVKTDAEGKPVKALKKDGTPGKLNVIERVAYASEADIPATLLLGPARFERLKLLVGLRDLFVKQINLETEDAPALKMEGNRRQLAAAYKAFTDAHGWISEPANSSLVDNMPDGALVQALELSYRPAISALRAKKIGEQPRPATAEPAPILSQRVVTKYEPPGTAASGADALQITLSEFGRVNLERIGVLLGKTEAEVIEDLHDGMAKPLIFKDPETGIWETRNDYLSGQVRRKLIAARSAGLAKNVAALEAVQPEPIGAENVTALLGSSWVPPDTYADFFQHMTGQRPRVSFGALTNTFAVSMPSPSSKALNEQWGSDGMRVETIIEKMLNTEPIRVYSQTEDGPVINHELTKLAQLKASQIANEFGDWVFADSARRNALVDIFNEKFNTRVLRQHDGSHLVLPGKVPDAILKMRRHQKNAIWRGISERFMLLDHVVGAGKTFTAIARAMERRRMGLSKKPMIVVPNHMVQQFTSDVYRLYPGAKVLAVGKADLVKKRRRRAFAKIASGDWDIVIMPHSSFGFIGIAPETEERYLEAELAAAEAAIKEAWAASEESEGSFRKPPTVKQAERLRDKKRERLDRIKGRDKADRLLTFEQMGVDDLTVDEAHEFKNLFYSSRLADVKGMGNQTGSQKAADLYNKVRTLRESPTGSVTFLTGTPISNSAVEMYSMMRYLAADELRELGLEHFDAWRAQFVSTDPGWEANETGRLKEVNRLGRTWSNMRSLMDLYYSFTDSVGNDDIKAAFAEDNPGQEFPIPRVKGGDRRSVIVQPTKAQSDELQEVIEGFDGLPSIQDPQDRNKQRLRLMDRARKVSLDVRAANPGSTSDEKGGKLDVLAGEVARIYEASNADRGTQLIFLDRSVPKAKGDTAILKDYDAKVAARDAALAARDEDAYRRALDALEGFDENEMAEVRRAQAGGWNAYQQIKDNLIARGIPEAEIRFIQEANNDAQKQALFDAVNDGTVRVLIGSTQRMGAGTNVQQRLVGLHHGDVTWKPSDIEQREGRIIRQGNKLLAKYGIDKFEVEILAYATERTIDAKMWGLNSAKLRTINGIRKYDGAFTMEFEDQESVSMAEMAALASGDPLLMERVKLTSEIDKLELLERQHRRKNFGIDSAIDSAEADIKRLPKQIAGYEARAAAMTAAVDALNERVAARRVTVEGKVFDKMVDAIAEAETAIGAQQGGNDKARYSVNVNGQKYTNKDGYLGAIHEGFGDVRPFEAVIGGQTFTVRTDAQREIARLAHEAAVELIGGGTKTLDLGTFAGLKLEGDVSMTVAGGSYQLELTVLGDDGATLASSQTERRDNNDFTTASIAAPLRALDLMPESATSSAEFMAQRLERAKAELPDLRARQGQPFPQKTELDAKRARLEAVTRELSVGAPAAGAEAEDVDLAEELRTRGVPVESRLDAERLLDADGWRLFVGHDMGDPEGGDPPREALSPSDLEGFTPDQMIALPPKPAAPAPREQTPGFKHWFKGSQVVDAAGAPKVMYHATHVNVNPRNGEGLGDFEVFDRFATKRVFGRESLDQIGSWFSDGADDKGAGRYAGGAIYPVYLSIKKPWATTFEAMRSQAQRLSGQPVEGTDPATGFQVRPNAKSVAALDAWLDAQGFDGIHILHDPGAKNGSMEFADQDVWIARRPEQIKSAIGNSGAFDPSKPSMLETRVLRPALPHVTVEPDESGFPTFRGNDLRLEFPQVTARLEVIEGPGQKVVNYAITPESGFDVLGHVELLMENGRATSLLDIHIDPARRKAGIGRRVIATLLAAQPGADLNISNIVGWARGFWAKMGVPEQNVEAGAAYDGTLNSEDFFAQAADDRGAPSAVRAGEGAGGQRDTGAEGRRAGAGRPAQGEGTETREVGRPGPAGTVLGRVFDNFASLGSEPGTPWQGLREAGSKMNLPVRLKPVRDETLSPFTVAVFDPDTGIISFNPKFKLTRAEWAQAMAEELLHAVDVIGPHAALSATASRLALGRGDIALEAQRVFDSGRGLADFLSYPLDRAHKLSPARQQAELFARLGVLYHGDQALMQRELPIAYEAYHDLFGTTLLGPQQRVLRDVRAGAGAGRGGSSAQRPGAGPDGRAVRGDAAGQADPGLDALRARVRRIFGSPGGPAGGVAPERFETRTGPPPTTPPPRSPWRDATNRLQFAPGQWLYSALGRAAGPLLARIGMKPMSKELSHQMRAMKIAVQKAQETAAAVAREAQVLSQPEREMVSDIIEQELATGVTPPAHAVQLAAMMSQTLSDQSRELVALGMLSEEAASRWDGKYLPRFYQSKLRKQVGAAWADAVRRVTGRTSVMKGIKGSHLKMRGRTQVVGVNELADFQALGWQIRDPGYEEGVSETVRVWRDFSREEREAMGEIRDAGFRFIMGYMQTQRDLALGRMFAGMAADPEQSARADVAPEGWVQVPRTQVDGTGMNRYGRLAGRYVPRETMSHLSAIEESSSEAWLMYRKALSIWKEGKTVLNPGSHVNNTVGNLTMAHLAGVGYHRADKYVGAFKDFIWKAPMVKEAHDAGLFLGSMSHVELTNTLPKELRDLVARSDSSTVRGARFVYNLMTLGLRRPLGAAYGAEDSFFRYLIYKDARSRGLDPTDAVDYAQKYIFTYDDLPKGARRVRDFGIPFFAYTYKAVPALAHTALTHPVRFAAPAGLIWTANAVAYALAVGDDDDDWTERLQKYATDPAYRARADALEAEEQKNLPPWMRGYTAMFTRKVIRLGTDSVTQLPLFIDVSRLIPASDINDVAANVPGAMTWPQAIAPSHPVISAYTGLRGNVDLWTGKPIADLNDTTAESTAKRAAWLWKLVAPAIVPGSAHYERTIDALANAYGGDVPWLPDVLTEHHTGIGKDRLPVQPGYAALQTVGIKVRPQDLDTSHRIDAYQREKLVREIVTELRKLKRLEVIGAVRHEVFERERVKAMQKIQHVREGLTVEGDER